MSQYNTLDFAQLNQIADAELDGGTRLAIWDDNLDGYYYTDLTQLTNYFNVSAGGVGGSGTTGALAKFSASSTVTDSLVSESGSVVTVTGPLTVTGDTPPLSINGVAYVLPSADGTDGQALTTDGAGTLSWTTISGGGGGISGLTTGTVPKAASSTSIADSNITISGSAVTVTGSLIVTTGITGTLAGNASSATKLATARAINGVDFDGTAPITISSSPGPLTLNPQTGDYTPVVGDEVNTLVQMNSASAHALTIPPNSSQAFAVGSVLLVQQLGTHVYTVSPGSGVTLHYPGGFAAQSAGQYSGMTFIKTATDAWAVLAGAANAEKLVQTGSISAGAVAWDCALGQVMNLPMTANLTSITVTNPPASGSLGILRCFLKANGTGYTQAWSVNGVTAVWDGGTAPTLPTTNNHVMVVEFHSRDGFVAEVHALLVAQEYAS